MTALRDPIHEEVEREISRRSEPDDGGTREHEIALSAEASVLGAIIYSSSIETYDEASDILNADDFCADAHRVVWDAMTRLRKMNVALEGPTIQENIQSCGTWVFSFPLQNFLLDLLQNATSGSEYKDYIRLIARSASKRRLITAGQDIIHLAQQPGHDKGVSALIEEAKGKIQSVEDLRKHGSSNWKDARNSVSSALERLDEKMAGLGAGQTIGLTTGLDRLDRAMSGGMHGGDLIILAGRPGMGKTSLAVNIARAAAHSGGRVAFLSLEMDEDQLGFRIASSEARALGEGRIEYRSLRSGSLGQSEIATLKTAAAQVPSTLHFEFTGKLTMDQVKAKVRALRRKLGGLDLIVIDYLQFMRIDAERNKNFASAIGDVTGEMKAMAKEYKCPFICLSQLNRNVELRDNKRPFMSDLRDSGSIEQDADFVLFPYRDEYYLEKQQPRSGNQEDIIDYEARLGNARGKMEIAIAKARMGPTSTVDVYFEAATDTIVDDQHEIKEKDLL